MEKQFKEFKEIEKWICDTTDIEADNRITLSLDIYKVLKDQEDRDYRKT